MTRNTHEAPGLPAWRSRIVGYEDLSPAELTANPKNWRTHPKNQRKALAAVLGEVGVVQNIVLNQTTGHLIDGHLRVELAEEQGQATVPVTVVELTEAEEALVLTTLDPLSGMAKRDNDKLADLLAMVTKEDRPDLAPLLKDLAGIMPENTYTQKITSPVYEPKGDQPDPKDLCDKGKALALIEQVEAAGLADDVRAFLIAASQRHLVFDYQRIADYYAHAPEEVQALMEASALVIIDFGKAIEHGYVQLSEEIREQYLRDYGEPGAGDDG